MDYDAAEEEEEEEKDEGEEEGNEEEEEEESGLDGLYREEEVEVMWETLRRLDWLPLLQAAITDVLKR